MEQINGTRKPSSNEYARVTNAAGVLVSQACSVSASHIRDGMLRLQFNRHVADYARGIVRDVAEGKKSPEWGMQALKKESRELWNTSTEIPLKAVGLSAGLMQAVTGFAICAVKRDSQCVTLGVPAILHGVNNAYENGANIVTGRSDTVGPIRIAYQNIAALRGYGSHVGNAAYYGVDLTLSVRNLYRKTLKPDAWKLFHHLKSDKVRVYTLMGKSAWAFQVLTDTITLNQIYQETQDDE